jgi:hypothetical protein
MKPLLLLLLLGATTAVSAQNKKLDSLQQQLRERLARKYQRMPNAWGRQDTYVFRLKERSDSTGASAYVQAKPRTPGVYSLPQDGMPCVVPDTEGIVPIPNAFANPRVPYSSPQNMPNPMDKTLRPLTGRE